MNAAPEKVSPDRRPLRATLDRLADLGSNHLKRWRFNVALREAVRWAPLWLVALPLLALLAQLAGILPAGKPGPIPLAALAVLGPVSYVVVRVAWSAYRFRPARAFALALHDRSSQSEDRLVTADEFLTSAELETDAPQSAFMRAAVADAVAHARNALGTPLRPLPLPAWRIQPGSWWGVAAALAVMALARVTVDHSVASRPEAGALRVAAIAPTAPVKPADAVGKTARPPRPAVPPGAAEPAAGDKSPAAAKALRRMPRTEQPMDGQPASGSGAGASSSSGGNHAAGLAGGQKSAPKAQKPEAAPAEEPEEKQTPDSKKKKAPRKQDASQLAMESGSGQGKSSSASSSLNAFEAPEEKDKAGQGLQPDAEDQGLEDEDEQQKSNSVSKPMGETKKPTVDRNLSTSPPGQPDENANGRGGPGEIKKTRGVPSMILGIPMPDRVPGTPSPGRSKVTQEFTRPKEEAFAPLEAQTHAARTGLVGHVEQPDLVPWRRAVVENYFMSLRSRAEDGPPPGAAPAND